MWQNIIKKQKKKKDFDKRDKFKTEDEDASIKEVKKNVGEDDNEIESKNMYVLP